MDRKKRIACLLVALAITLACVPALPIVAPLPTQPVGAVDTIVAGTYAAASTGTALKITSTPTPADTLTPSRTPTITPTATATVIFKTPTSFLLGGGGSGGGGGGGGGSSGGGTDPTIVYKCLIVKVTPANNTHFAPNTNFTTTWQLKNTGNIRWYHNSVDYRHYVSKPSLPLLHLQAIYDLPKDVDPGGQVLADVDMRSPATNGTYTTTWTLRVGDKNFCSMKLTIKVP